MRKFKFNLWLRNKRIVINYFDVDFGWIKNSDPVLLRFELFNFFATGCVIIFNLQIIKFSISLLCDYEKYNWED